MYVKAIYSDFSTWEGKVEEWPKSPQTTRDFGVLVICVWLNESERINLCGYDYYALKLLGGKLRIEQWTGFKWIIDDKQHLEPLPADPLFRPEEIRTGKMVPESAYDLALKVSQRWRVTEEVFY